VKILVIKNGTLNLYIETEDCISQKSAAVWSVIIVLVVLLVFVGVGAAIFVGYWRQLRRRRRQKTKTGDSEYAEIEEPYVSTSVVTKILMLF